MTSERERVLSDFIDAWNAGRRPDVDAFLAQVAAAERDALADEIAAFVAWAPDPDYDDDAMVAVTAEAVTALAAAGAAEPASWWSAWMPLLRERAALTRAGLAARLGERLGLAAGARAKTERYLAELEGGRLDPSGLSRRLLDALAGALGIGADVLHDAAHGRPAAAPLFRGDDVSSGAAAALDVLADALTAEVRDGWDEVDVLFRGGA
ncbi:MAG: hypothetical protein IRZ32_11575 [Solirubrobacteraceae bacterium]|nr:hypothetical protein [Solirubrobacteraceae bacterium]